MASTSSSMEPSVRFEDEPSSSKDPSTSGLDSGKGSLDDRLDTARGSMLSSSPTKVARRTARSRSQRRSSVASVGMAAAAGLGGPRRRWRRRRWGARATTFAGRAASEAGGEQDGAAGDEGDAESGGDVHHGAVHVEGGDDDASDIDLQRDLRGRHRGERRAAAHPQDARAAPRPRLLRLQRHPRLYVAAARGRAAAPRRAH